MAAQPTTFRFQELLNAIAAGRFDDAYYIKAINQAMADRQAARDKAHGEMLARRYEWLRTWDADKLREQAETESRIAEQINKRGGSAADADRAHRRAIEFEAAAQDVEAKAAEAADAPDEGADDDANSGDE